MAAVCSVHSNLNIILIYITGFVFLCQVLFSHENQMFFCQTQNCLLSMSTHVKSTAFSDSASLLLFISVEQKNKEIQITCKGQPYQIWNHQISGILRNLRKCFYTEIHQIPQKKQPRKCKEIPSCIKEKYRPQEIHCKLYPIQHQCFFPFFCFW